MQKVEKSELANYFFTFSYPNNFWWLPFYRNMYLFCVLDGDACAYFHCMYTYFTAVGQGGGVDEERERQIDRW